jgi:hypothetical protein
MQRTKYLKGPCSHCGGSIEYPAQMVGLPTQCPHCGQQTELSLETPAQEPAISRRAVAWIIMTLLIIGLGALGLRMAYKSAERLAHPGLSTTNSPSHP